MPDDLSGLRDEFIHDLEEHEGAEPSCLRCHPRPLPVARVRRRRWRLRQTEKKSLR